MGYSNEQSQLMTVPPNVEGCIATIAGGYMADRSKKRGVYMNLFCVIAILGIILLISTTRPHLQYAGTFFLVSGYVLLCPFQVS
jgi:nitrate/nitrite transporter NarK